MREAVNEVRENLGLELFPSSSEELQEEPAAIEEIVQEIPEIEELEAQPEDPAQEAVNS